MLVCFLVFAFLRFTNHFPSRLTRRASISRENRELGRPVGQFLQNPQFDALMPRRIHLRFVLPAVVGAVVGFLALAYAIPNESALSAVLVCLISPGLKIAELTVPARHESLAFTFGWFLRIAIGVNAAYYFVILAVATYLVDRRRK